MEWRNAADLGQVSKRIDGRASGSTVVNKWSTCEQPKLILVGLTAHCPATDFVELLGATRAEELDAAWCRSCW